VTDLEGKLVSLIEPIPYHSGKTYLVVLVGDVVVEKDKELIEKRFERVTVISVHLRHLIGLIKDVVLYTTLFQGICGIRPQLLNLVAKKPGFAGIGWGPLMLHSEAFDLNLNNYI
jgi:hypothetical protein